MTVLHPAVSRRTFEPVRRAFEEARDAYDEMWELVRAAYPYIAVHVKNEDGQPCVGILIDLSDWPHRPARYLPFDLTFSRRLRLDELPAEEDPDGRRHIVQTQNGEVWFCVHGTHRYHVHYRRAVPWEEFRHLETNQPVRVLEECIKCIDRSELQPIGGPQADDSTGGDGA